MYAPISLRAVNFVNRSIAARPGVRLRAPGRPMLPDGLEEGFAVLRELGLADPVHPAQRVEGRRPELRHLDQAAIGKHHVSRNALLARKRRPARLQAVEQRLVEWPQDRGDPL